MRIAPEARHLTGVNPWTSLALPVLLALHWGLAWAVGQTNILVCFLAAFFVGQLLIHSAGALLHETAHRLIFHDSRAKLAFDLGLEAMLGSFGKQLTYQNDHIRGHHPHLGDYELDYEHEDLCHLSSRQWIKLEKPFTHRMLVTLTLVLHLLPFGFLIGDIVLPRLYRSFSGKSVRDETRKLKSHPINLHYRLLFIAVSLATNIFLFLAFGFLGWLYHNWSLSLFLGKCGVTNLGQSLSEHDGDNEQAPTYSDYRFINFLLFNTGYHNEHHTFPNVPWNRLPGLKRLAPNYFNRENPKNYVALWLDHISKGFSPSRKSHIEGVPLAQRCQAAPDK